MYANDYRLMQLNERMQLEFQLMFYWENTMNDNQVLGILFGIAVVTILLIGAGLGLFVYWLLG